MRRAVSIAIPLGFLGFCVVVSMLVSRPDSAEGSEALMQTLPAYNRFRCLICHVDPVPTPASSALNSFGVDFQANGNKWDATLALLNSDSDACPNGFELGDRDGDGALDVGIVEEHSNPGNTNDCRVALLEGTWGKLKALFGE